MVRQRAVPSLNSCTESGERLFKLQEYTNAATVLATSLRESRVKITVFFVAIFTVVISLGAMQNFSVFG